MFKPTSNTKNNQEVSSYPRVPQTMAEMVLYFNRFIHEKDMLKQREFDEKKIEKTAKICYNENNHKLRKQKGGFFYGTETNSNFLRCR